MKKVVIILLALALAVSFAACSGGSENQSGTNNSTKEPAASANSGTDNTPSSGATPAAPDDETPTAEREPVAGSEGLEIKDYGDTCEVRKIGSFTGTELIIPSHFNGHPVTHIDEDAISNDTMKSLFIPWTVVSIGEDAVSSSANLETVTFSEGLVGLGSGAFSSCKALKKVSLPSTLEYISGYAFVECTALEEVTVSGNAEVERYAFQNCSALKTFAFTGNSTRPYSIKNSVFEGDTALETVTLTEGLGTIGSFAFSGCTSLGTIYLPASLSKIEASAFSNVGTLKVFYAGSEEDWAKISVANGNDSLVNAEIVYNHK